MADPTPKEPPAKSLTAADLKATKDKLRKIVVVELAGLGNVHVRSLTGLELDQLEDSMTDDKGKYIPENARAKVVALCACDAGGKPLFPFTPESVKEVGQLDGPTVIQPIYDAAMALNKRRAVDRQSEKKD
jgi:hypothetical protein